MKKSGFPQILSWLRKRQIRRQERFALWKTFLDTRFAGFTFPIAVIELDNISIVHTLDQYAHDPDIHFFEFHKDTLGIDSKGLTFSWTYDASQETNIPERIGTTIQLDNISAFINSRIPSIPSSPTDKASSIADYFVSLDKHLS